MIQNDYDNNDDDGETKEQKWHSENKTRRRLK